MSVLERHIAHRNMAIARAAALAEEEAEQERLYQGMAQWTRRRRHTHDGSAPHMIVAAIRKKPAGEMAVAPSHTPFTPAAAPQPPQPTSPEKMAVEVPLPEETGVAAPSSDIASPSSPSTTATVSPPRSPPSSRWESKDDEACASPSPPRARASGTNHSYQPSSTPSNSPSESPIVSPKALRREAATGGPAASSTSAAAPIEAETTDHDRCPTPPSPLRRRLLERGTPHDTTESDEDRSPPLRRKLSSCDETSEPLAID